MPSPRPGQIPSRLQEFNFKTKHRPGSNMQHVDSLSRAPVEAGNRPLTVADHVLKVVRTEQTEDWVYGMQMQDEKLKAVCEVLRGSARQNETTEAQVKADYKLVDNRLFRKIEGQLRLVVPRAVRWRVTKACHDDAGHFALEKTIQRIQKHFWFPRVRRYVKSYIASCEECCYHKVRGGKSESQLHVRDVLPIPFRDLYIDHMGPFVRSKKGNSFLLVVVCGFSKYVVLKATRNTAAEPVVRALIEVMAIFGQPLRITSDRGTAYTSRQFKKFVEENGIHHVKTAVRTPRANGQVERANKTVLTALRCLVKDDREWDSYLSKIQWALNSQRSEVTKHAPNELVFHYCPRDVTHNRLIQAVQDGEGEPTAAELICAEAADNIRRQRLKWKERYDRAHRQPRQYAVGDLVLIENVPAATGQSRKLEPAYKGPYVVTKALDFDRYIIEDLPDAEKGGRRYVSVHSVDHLKPWCISSPDMDDDDSDGSSGEDERSGTAELSPTADNPGLGRTGMATQATDEREFEVIRGCNVEQRGVR